jgi:ubiquinone/menaquinone biosynthesis C-methylase UbiE
MIRLGRERWLESTLKVCDVTNLHYWRNNTFTAIHSNNVFEHFKPGLVPFILEELHRVTKPDGILFTVLDTSELYERQKRDMSKEDPTHFCVKPMAWWEAQLEQTGWKLAPDLLQACADHPDSFFKQYDWPCFVARKA